MCYVERVFEPYTTTKPNTDYVFTPLNQIQIQILYLHHNTICLCLHHYNVYLGLHHYTMYLYLHNYTMYLCIYTSTPCICVHTSTPCICVFTPEYTSTPCICVYTRVHQYTMYLTSQAEMLNCHLGSASRMVNRADKDTWNTGVYRESWEDLYFRHCLYVGKYDKAPPPSSTIVVC